MNLVDLLLNVAALLLWISWRATGFARTTSPRIPFSPLLRPDGGDGSRRHFLLLGLLVLLLVRSWLYWQLGAEVNWVASLDLGIISLPFKSVALPRMVLYSYLSFLAIWAAFHLWLLLLSIVNRSLPDTNPVQKSIRQHLSWVGSWPVLLKLIAPWMLIAALWYVCNPLLVGLGVATRPRASLHIWQQGALIGLGAFLVWRYLIGLVLLLHVVNSYLYLGNHPFWVFINATARNLMRPIRWLPLRLGRIDLTPVLGIALTFLGFGLAEAGVRHLFAQLPR